MSSSRSRFAGLAILALMLTALPFAPRVTSAAGRPLTRRWHLEFRILATEKDEPKALTAAKKYFAQARTDARRKAELKQLARDDKPPAPLAIATDKAPGYTWMEIGPAELRSLRLDNASASDPERNKFWKRVAAARDKGEAFLATPWMRSTLLYSRPCQNTMLSAKERAAKKYDYFLLTRDPEKGKAVTGAYLTKVTSEPDGVAIELSKKGGELLKELTTKNRPSEEDISKKRHVAIIVDGQISLAPVLNGVLDTQAYISGDFTKKEVSALAELLRKDMAEGKKK